ncbi:DUF427 domain-containing protein [Mycobacterium sp. SMC-4]|uniref:DUF427 domain-containing protein n=1 Tax=Mycobacterium sp. SMC-4 TaxID=2857059 RepID=UPI0021B3C145|nr:DUF427 domain-containing protein [Mycobacterium sp. SMC-4]UXA17911.1 DUF427 domain-containing protein [Mycobacterium sp. SMC-4]
MPDPRVLVPTASHPISVVPTGRHVVVRVDGAVIAESDAALTLREASYPAVQYIPMAYVLADRLRPSDTSSYCPYKGQACYFNVVTADGTVTDAIWSYPEPHPAVAQIAGHVAFYPDKADVSIDA